MTLVPLPTKCAKSHPWAENLNKLYTEKGRKFQFSAQVQEDLANLVGNVTNVQYKARKLHKMKRFWTSVANFFAKNWKKDSFMTSRKDPPFFRSGRQTKVYKKSIEMWQNLMHFCRYVCAFMQWVNFILDHIRKFAEKNLMF